MFGQESLLPGISNQLALGGIVIAIALYTLYHVCVFPSAYSIDANSTQISTATDIPYIKGIPEIPGALPVTGHLLQLGDDHATDQTPLQCPDLEMLGTGRPVSRR